MSGVALHVLMLCTGNHCRSPMAERLLAALARQHDLDWEVRSSGTHGLVDCPAHRHAVTALDEVKVDLDDFRGRDLSAEDLAWADVVVAMEEHHADYARRMDPASAGAVRLLAADGVPDPMGGDLAEFRRCRDQLQRLLEQVVEAGGF